MNKTNFLMIVLCLFLTACAANNTQPTSLPQPSQPSVLTVESTQTNTPTQPTVTEEQPTMVEPTVLPTTRLTATPWPQPTSGPTPTGGSESIVFGLSTRQAEKYLGAGIFLFNFRTSQLTPIFEEGYRLQAVSPDGKWLLVNQGTQLYLSGLLGDQPVLLSSTLVDNSGITAIWTGDGEHILWIERNDTVNRLVIADSLGENPNHPQSWLEHQPMMLFPTASMTQVVWKAGICSDQTYCSSGVWISDIDQQISRHADKINLPNFLTSPNGYVLALVQDQEQINLEIWSQSNFDLVQILDTDEDYPTAFDFSGDGSRVAVVGQIRSEYSGKNFGNRILIFSEADWQPKPIGNVDGLNAVLSWSPDDQHLAVMTTTLDEAGYRIELVRQNAFSVANQVYTDDLSIKNPAFIFVSALAWVP